MKLTKYQHACFVVEKDGSALIVDPGAFTHDLIMPRRVDGIIITHDHPDHFDEALVQKILDKHPKATLISTETISGRYSNYTALTAHIAEPLTVGAFSVRFFGGIHAPIADTIPTPQNVGVLIDERLYYPGDSFVVPDNVAVRELALPASAPWLKISDAMSFLENIKPSFTFPTHDALLSNEGKQLVDRMLGAVASGQNTQYKRLDSQSIELS